MKILFAILASITLSGCVTLGGATNVDATSGSYGPDGFLGYSDVALQSLLGCDYFVSKGNPFAYTGSCVRADKSIDHSIVKIPTAYTPTCSFTSNTVAMVPVCHYSVSKLEYRYNNKLYSQKDLVDLLRNQ